MQSERHLCVPHLPHFIVYAWGSCKPSTRLAVQGRTMLVLSRKKDEKIIIGDNITVMVIEIRGDKVRLGIEAPKKSPYTARKSTTRSSAETGREAGCRRSTPTNDVVRNSSPLFARPLAVARRRKFRPSFLVPTTSLRGWGNPPHNDRQGRGHCHLSARSDRSCHPPRPGRPRPDFERAAVRSALSGPPRSAAADPGQSCRHAAIVTGFFIPAADPPAAETDGPPVRSSWRWPLNRWASPTLVTDSNCAVALRAAVAPGRRSIFGCRLPVRRRSIGGRSAAELWIDEFEKRSGPHVDARDRHRTSRSQPRRAVARANRESDRRPWRSFWRPCPPNIATAATIPAVHRRLVAAPLHRLFEKSSSGQAA